MAIQDPDKLQVRWAGPMRVTRVIDNWSFEVEDLVYGRKTIRHAQMMRPYADQELGVTAALREQIGHDDHRTWLVDSIMDWRRRNRGPLELLVRWVGYGADSDTWQLFSTLAEDVPVIVRRFVDALPPGRRTDLVRTAATRAGI